MSFMLTLEGLSMSSSKQPESPAVDTSKVCEALYPATRKLTFEFAPGKFK